MLGVWGVCVCVFVGKEGSVSFCFVIESFCMGYELRAIFLHANITESIEHFLLETDASSETKVGESVHTLERSKDELLKQRELLEQKLQEGSLLDPKEERR